ncbi:MAG: hypothetical protein OXG68_14670 [Chloroflexi bacterium]|nr:hypothetical protein [Chloroflexota bacterium]
MAITAPLTLARVVVIALYVVILPVSFRWLIPSLSSAAKKLAIITLAAQALVVAIALYGAGTDTYFLRLFHIHREESITTAVAGLQLALIGELALLTACCGQGRPAWSRLHMAGLGLLFFFLAWDELFMLHEYMGLEHWELAYAVLGLLVVALTTLVMVRSPRHTWIWYICLLTGLAITAVGALLIEQLRFMRVCGELGLVHHYTFLDRDICLTYLIEEPMEMLGIWLMLVATLGLLSIVVAQPKLPLRALLYVLPIVSFLAIISIRNPSVEAVQRRIQADSADVTFESGIQLYGFQMERGPDETDLQVVLWLSASPFRYHGLGYSIHLIDPISATSYSSENVFVTVSGKRIRGPWYLPVYRQFRQLGVPAQVPRNRAFLVVLSMWREAGDEYVLQRIVSSDHKLLSDSQVVLGEVVLPRGRAAYAFSPLAGFDNAITLGAVDLPAQARPGDTLSITFSWRAEQVVTEDYVQFLHFGNEKTGEWWVYDSPPLGARLPSRLWYSGLADFETWEIPLPADLAPGRYLVFTGLYRASDLERLEARDAGGGQFLDARVPLGAMILERG